ncbi:ATP dependent DNA ligase domain-containing protein [Powellomyces hirtus]|nr:ATP dependent DNA ligase domain-containing protein [Powellomyces hirtus]
MEQTWIARVIMKDLKLGVSEKTILKIWHPDGLDLFNVCNDLAEVTKELRDPKKRLGQSDIDIFKPFKPMLSRRVDKMEHAVKAMGHGTFWIETKLDGERMQMHMRRTSSGCEFGWWSRNATDYTPDYGASDKEGSLAPYIYELFPPTVKNVILDGELMAYNTETQIYEPFGALKTASKEVLQFGENAKLRVCFIVFDIVYWNGRSLLDQSLTSRYNCLLKVLKEKKTFLEINPHTEGSSVADLITAMDQRMEHMEEGLCIKNPMSLYQPSTKCDDWLKMKPDYLEGQGDDVDVLLIAGFYGEGRRRGVLSHFMCAILEDPPPPNQEPRWMSFCRFGSGYKLDEIESISRQREGIWRTYDPNRLPSWFLHPRGSKEKPDMIIASPHNAIVVQLKAFQIVPSDQYASKWTLRFPRFVKIRDDKSLDSTLTQKEMLEIAQKGDGRMQTRRLLDPNFASSPDSKTKGIIRRPNVQATVKVASQYQAVDVSKVSKDKNWLAGMEVCVLPGAGVQLSKQEAKDVPPELLRACEDRRSIWVTMKKYGGSAVANPTSSTTMIIADQHTLAVSNFIRSGHYDIVHSRYLLVCLLAKKILPLTPRYMIYTSPVTTEKFKECVDKWGDSYFDDLRVSTMKELFSHMDTTEAKSEKKRKRSSDQKADISSPKRTRDTTIEEIDERYFSMTPHEGSLFRRIRVYLDRFHDLRVSSSLTSQLASYEPPTEITIVPTSDDETESKVPPPECLQDSWLDIVALKLRVRGAVVVDAIDEFTTHVVLDVRSSPETLTSRVQLVRHLLALLPDRHAHRHHLVGQPWVDKSIDVGRMVPEKDYEIGYAPGKGVIVGGVGKAM